MTERPTGTVTFLFTDIEGSTRLWEQHPEAMERALACHDAVLRQVIETHRGHVFKTMGDAFCAAFGSADDALRAAIAAQRALQKEAEPLRVRTAIHTGDASCREGDYFGPALNRVARLLSAAHGGQILLSAATARQLPPSLPAEAALLSLGAHRLRDIAVREMIFQLLAPGLRTDFPPLNTLDVAFRRGFTRAAAVSVMIVAVIAGLALTALRQARKAEEGQRALRRTLYAADIRVADQAWEAGNLGVARELLEAHRPERDREELRGFEWRLLWRLTQGDDLFALHGHTDEIFSLVFLPTRARRVPGGSWLLVSGSLDKTVRQWEIAGNPPKVSGRQVGTPLRLTAGLRSMAISPDGMVLAAGLMDGTLMLWDLPARRLAATRKAHTQLIRAVLFSPDGRLLVTASGDGTLKLWRMPACRVVGGFRSRDPRTIGLDAAALAPSGKVVAIAAGGSVTLWEVATQRVQATFQGFATRFWTMTFSPDGAFLAAGSYGGDLRVWDLAAPGGRPRLAADVAAHTGTIDGVVFSPDGKRLATASADHLVKLWAFAPARARRTVERTPLPVLQLVDSLRGHTSGAGRVAFSPDGKILATGGADSVVRLWGTLPKRYTDTLKGWPFQPVRGSWQHPEGLVLSADGRLLATGSGDGFVHIWDLAAGGGSKPVIFRAHREGVNSLAVSPDSRVLATASDDQTVRLWDVTHPVPPGYPPKAGELRCHQGAVNAVAFSPDGKRLVMGGDDGTVRLWGQPPPARPEPGGWGATRRVPAAGGWGPRARSGPTLRAPAPEGRLDGRSWRQIAVLRGQKGGVRSVAFSPDGATLASVGDDKTVRLWRLAKQGPPTLRSVTVLMGHQGLVNCVAFSPDGRLVASGGWDSTIRLWDVAGKRDPLVLRGHQWGVRALAFSPDGRTLASGSEDFTVRLWNLATGRELATLKGHTVGVQGLAFSADGKLLVSGSADGTVRLWRAATFAETDAPARQR